MLRTMFKETKHIAHALYRHAAFDMSVCVCVYNFPNENKCEKIHTDERIAMCTPIVCYVYCDYFHGSTCWMYVNCMYSVYRTRTHSFCTTARAFDLEPKFFFIFAAFQNEGKKQKKNIKRWMECIANKVQPYFNYHFGWNIHTSWAWHTETLLCDIFWFELEWPSIVLIFIFRTILERVSTYNFNPLRLPEQLLRLMPAKQAPWKVWTGPQIVSIFRSLICISTSDTTLVGMAFWLRLNSLSIHDGDSFIGKEDVVWN